MQRRLPIFPGFQDLNLTKKGSIFGVTGGLFKEKMSNSIFKKFSAEALVPARHRELEYFLTHS